ncbi:hypothetical protein DSO57_1017919 [Entomophthora muscae]|uniref:Uncharacterized protein n=1 Tax=Entomophthora muscae TaxID=34485 RepID=A0ACC2S6B4_9FUNG|nr:hypothetical protein DSO57_1017919 [Entomophthora muscae]
MKFIVPFVCTALVCGDTRKDWISSTEELCSINATVFSVAPYSQIGDLDGVPLKTESDVKACKKRSGAKIFRIIIVNDESTVSSKEAEYKYGHIRVDNIHTLYGHEDYKFYDGFEFNIASLDETTVDRLLKERRPGQMFSLATTLDELPGVENVIRKYAAKIHHIVLDLDINEETVADLKEVLQRSPEIPFSVKSFDDDLEAVSVAKEVATSLSRKVGQTGILSNPTYTPLEYTTGV